MPLLGSRMPVYGPPARQTGKLLRKSVESSDRALQLVTAAREDLADTIQRCIAGGVGFLISPTSDGGAVSVTVYAGDKRERDYAGNPDDLTALFEAVRDFADASLYEGTKKSP